MKTTLEGGIGYGLIILIFIGVITLILLPTVLSIPLWSQNSTRYASGTSASSYSSTKVHGFQINWTDNVGGVGAIKNVTFEANFTNSTPNESPYNLKNYTIGVNITGSNNTQGVWWINMTPQAGTFVYRWYATNTSDNGNVTDSFIYTINKRTICSVILNDDFPAGAKYPVQVNFTIDTTADTGNNDVTYMLWQDSLNVRNVTGNGIFGYNATLGAGTYSYSINRTDGMNYSTVDDCGSYAGPATISKGNHRITILLNGSSSNQTYEKGSIANITIVSNATIDNITANMSIYSNFSGTNQSISSISGSVLNSLYNLTDTSYLPLGSYIISSNASATANYSSSFNASLILTVVDTIPPNIRLYNYTNGTFKGIGSSLTFNISVSDNDILNGNCTIRIANSSTLSNISGITNAKSGWCNGTITIPSDIGSDGNKTINITFSDSNNTGVNSSFVVWLDINAPTVGISVNPSSAYVGETIQISASSSDGSGIASQTVTVTKPDGRSNSYGGSIAYTPDQPGTYTATITATDTAGNSASASASFTIYQVSSGPSTPSLPTKTSTFDKIVPGEVKTMKIDEKIGITQIEISVKSVATEVTITVKKLDKKPDYIKVEAPDKLNRYIEITHQNIQDKLEKVKINFKVDKTWITSNNIDESTISLNRYADNKWNKLTTSKLSEDTNYTYFESDTTALSTFAVTGEEKIILIPPKEKPAENITKPEEEKLPEKIEERPKIPFAIYIISIIVLISLLIFLLTRKPMRKQRFK